MDDIAARDSIFEKRVAHGYFVLSAAAGLFVDPAPGPVLANYGLEGLRFVKPVYIGDTIQARLTVQAEDGEGGREGQVPQGVVRGTSRSRIRTASRWRSTRSSRWFARSGAPICRRTPWPSPRRWPPRLRRR